MITENTIVEMGDDMTLADLEGEAIIFDKRGGRYYGLNASGVRMLKLIEEPTPVSSIVDQMLKQYDVEREQLRADVLKILEGMLDRKLIKIKNGNKG